jgi:hypothetical protein
MTKIVSYVSHQHSSTVFSETQCRIQSVQQTRAAAVKQNAAEKTNKNTKSHKIFNSGINNKTQKVYIVS